MNPKLIEILNKAKKNKQPTSREQVELRAILDAYKKKVETKQTISETKKKEPIKNLLANAPGTTLPIVGALVSQAATFLRDKPVRTTWKAVQNLAEKDIKEEISSGTPKMFAPSVAGVRRVGKVTKGLAQMVGQGLYTVGGTVGDIVYGKDFAKEQQEKNPMVEKVLGEGVIPSWQTATGDIKKFYEEQETSTEFEKMYMAPILGTLGAALDMYPGGGKSASAALNIAVKKTVKDIAVENVKKKGIAFVEKKVTENLIKGGFSKEVIADALPKILKATDESSIKNILTKSTEKIKATLTKKSNAESFLLEEFVKEAKAKYKNPTYYLKSTDGSVRATLTESELKDFPRKLANGDIGYYGSKKPQGIKSLLDKTYNTPDEVPQKLYNYIQKNQSLLTSDANDATRWSRIINTLNDARYPNENITIFRAVDGNEIRPGDWVSTDIKYAQEHLTKNLKGKGKIVSEVVNGRDVLVSPTGNAKEAIFAPRELSYNPAQEVKPKMEVPALTKKSNAEALLAQGDTPFLNEFARANSIVKNTVTDPTIKETPSPSSILRALKDSGVSEEARLIAELPNGMRLSEVGKIIRNTDGSFKTAIPKAQLEALKNYTGKVQSGWVKNTLGKKIKTATQKSAEAFRLPAIYFEKRGLTEALFRPVIEAGRFAQDIKTDMLKTFGVEDIFKKGGLMTPPALDISAREAKNVQKYFLTRQGVDFGVTFDMLTDAEKKIAQASDKIFQKYGPLFDDVARRNNLDVGKVEGYAPMYTSKNMLLPDRKIETKLTDEVSRIFASTYKRVDDVPKGAYELDFRKVMSEYMEGMSRFLAYTDTETNLKAFVNTPEFLRTVNKYDKQVIGKWLGDIVSPTPKNKFLQNVRSASALASLGLNAVSVIKQAQTQLATTIVAKAPPKFRSQFAKDMGINVSELASLSVRAGDISVKDIKNKVIRSMTEPLAKFDRYNAKLSMNRFLDQEYKKQLKKGIAITDDVQKEIIRIASDRLDMWYGGYFAGQKPLAYRNEFMHTLTQFTYPTLSQLNGYAYSFYKAKGFGNKAKTIAETVAAVATIAYMDEVYEKLSFNWNSKEEMQKDLAVAVFGQVPIVGSVFYSLMNSQIPYVAPTVSALVKFLDEAIVNKDLEKASWAASSLVGVPKQVKRTVEGIETLNKKGGVDKNGKRTFKLDTEDTMEVARTLIRGKYGSLAGQEYVSGIGKPKTTKKTTNKKKSSSIGPLVP